MFFIACPAVAAAKAKLRHRVTRKSVPAPRYLARSTSNLPRHQTQMLRSRVPRLVRTARVAPRIAPERRSRKLRQIFQNLQRLRSERQVSLTEVPLPSQPAGGNGSIRVFEQTLETPVFLRPGQPPPEDAAAVKKKQEEEEKKKKEKKPTILDVATGMDKVFASTEALSEDEIFLLRKLTASMVVASTASEKAAADVLARLRTLEGYPKLLRLLTPYAWKFIWAMDTADQQGIPSVRSKMIGDLMVKAQAEMDETQEIAYVGGLFWHGSQETAMKRWFALKKRFSTSPQVWNLGVRLFALQQEPVKAEKIVNDMIKTLGYTEHKTFIPVIMAYNHIQDGVNAWRTYKRMQEMAKKRKERITARQFDELAMSFLDNMQPRRGLEIYKHMVYEGHDALDRQQTETYQNLQIAVQAAQREIVDPEALNEFSKDTIKNFPPHVANRVFYSGWMLNLMRMGRSDLAWYLVTDVMRQQQFYPDSTQCNWVIQGFIQEGNIELAEHVAEQMIAVRHRYVQGRKNPLPAANMTAPEVDPELLNTSTSSEDAAMLEDIKIRSTAPATVQTFSILIQHYIRRQRMDKVVELTSKMLECAIFPNSYILNHMLYSMLRSSDMERLARTFIQMVAQGKVQPDLVTFEVMWLAMWRHHTQIKRMGPEFLTPRQLFKMTVMYLSKRERENEENEGKMRDVWHYIIKSFLLARDLEGTLIVLHAGVEMWDMQIDSTVVQEVAFGVLRARPWDPNSERPKIGPEALVSSVARLQQLGREIVLQRAGGRKRAGQRKRGITTVLDEQEGTLESLTILLKNEMGDSTLVLDDLGRAYHDMGLEGVKLEQLNALIRQ
jgi:pentatricopeptide repeat protein